MARLPRFDLPGVAQHIVQRGNNRLPCFLDDGDRLRYLTLLGEALAASGVQLHAYVLMDNHVHLLATPPETGAISRLMQRLGRQYVGLFNARHARSGTLWEGRYKACLVDTEPYVLACYRYIELNPVRARMTDDPVAYRWSSCAANVGQRPHSKLTPHSAWHALGTSPEARNAAYRGLLDEALPADQLDEIRLYLQQQRAWGRDDFRAMVEAKTRRFAGTRPAHRPGKASHGK
ncbi:transposase [Luteimonas sp. MHLX1A]|uniref:transposase n=1 Tax=Alterluteimonas muca TaxID=2878684 RepID=UPI001E3C4DA9|nr:transposase [Luteimonas sp. MHLX1A]MCD9045525.1 transposase [Luteimonas sp. MHLX1A]